MSVRDRQAEEQAAALVRSLFCGLPERERRVAIFVAASDEATTGTSTGHFFFGGWVARERLWDRCFAPDWQRRVLNGPPKLDCLHMADWKSQSWRAKHGVTLDDIERRLDAAFDMVRAAGGLAPIALTTDAGHFREAFAPVKLLIKTEGGPARKRFEPDYVCFLHYVLNTLNYVHSTYDDVDRVEFVVERNDRITKHLHQAHKSIKKVLAAHGYKDLGRLIGDFIPGGKERVPLQAADMLLWHAQASKAERLSDDDMRRYLTIHGRPGLLKEFTKEEIQDFADRAGDGIILDDGDDGA